MVVSLACRLDVSGARGINQSVKINIRRLSSLTDKDCLGRGGGGGTDRCCRDSRESEFPFN